MRWHTIVYFIVSTAIISSCANLKPPPHPYDGLNKTSYGPVSQKQIRLCDTDAQAPDGSDTIGKAVADAIVDSLVAPIAGAMTVDPKIIDEELQDQFAVPGDAGLANVVILSRSDNEITFWYTADMVKPAEVNNAAVKYCKRHSGQAYYLGSSQICGPQTQLLLVINHKRVVAKPTFAIASYSCVASTAPNAPRKQRKTVTSN